MSVTSDLKKGAGSYLYIFISPQAKLNSAIMQKRARQIANLQAIDNLPFTPSYNELFQIVRQGIVDQYGKQPETILQELFNISMATKGIAGIGKLVPGTDIEYSDPSLLNPITLQPYKTVSEYSLDTVTLDDLGNKTAVKQKSNFWDGVKSVIEWIVKLIKELGIAQTYTASQTTPVPSEWSNLSTTSSAGFGTYVPYVIGAGIVLTLLTGKKKKSTT